MVFNISRENAAYDTARAGPMSTISALPIKRLGVLEIPFRGVTHISLALALPVIPNRAGW